MIKQCQFLSKGKKILTWLKSCLSKKYQTTIKILKHCIVAQEGNMELWLVIVHFSL